MRLEYFAFSKVYYVYIYIYYANSVLVFAVADITLPTVELAPYLMRSGINCDYKIIAAKIFMQEKWNVKNGYSPFRIRFFIFFKFV